jgi:hypothetical protein
VNDLVQCAGESSLHRKWEGRERADRRTGRDNRLPLVSVEQMLGSL